MQAHPQVLDQRRKQSHAEDVQQEMIKQSFDASVQNMVFDSANQTHQRRFSQPRFLTQSGAVRPYGSNSQTPTLLATHRTNRSKTSNCLQEWMPRSLSQPLTLRQNRQSLVRVRFPQSEVSSLRDSPDLTMSVAIISASPKQAQFTVLKTECLRTSQLLPRPTSTAPSVPSNPQTHQH